MKNFLHWLATAPTWQLWAIGSFAAGFVLGAWLF